MPNRMVGASMSNWKIEYPVSGGFVKFFKKDK